MSICKIVYRWVSFEKKIWHNKRLFLETFSIFASQYEFDSIALRKLCSKSYENKRIYSILKHNINKINRNLSVDGKASSKVLLIVDRIDDSVLYGVTYNTLKEVMSSDGQFDLHYPQIINTLENIYEKVYIIGGGKVSIPKRYLTIIRVIPIYV